MTAAARVFMGMVAVFLAAPLVVIVGVSLNEKRTLFFPPEGLSFACYAAVWSDPGWRGAVLNTLAIALQAATLAVLIALPIAYALWRRATWFGRIVQLMGVSPFVLPPVITALGALSFWITVGAYGAGPTVVISHAIFFTTLPLVCISLGFASIDEAVVDAARTMGATEWTLARTVLAPLVLPYVVAGFAFAFVLSLNEYIVAYMTVGFTRETVPIKIFNALRYGYTPVMASVSVLFVLTAIIVFSVVARFGDLPRLFGAYPSKER